MKKVIALIVGGVLVAGGFIAYLFGIKKIGHGLDEF